jgi:8-oxo-dGTP pyrophosphatase MutT (NUDIX family)
MFTREQDGVAFSREPITYRVASSDSGRRALLAELSAHRPYDERERNMVERLAAFVAAEPRCFERTLESGHLTGSAWVVDRGLQHVVLMHHRKLGKWLQLGGHADGDPDLRRVALREAREESGLSRIELARASIFDLDVHEIPERPNEPAHIHYDVRFAFFADAGAPLFASEESSEVAWVPIARVEHLGIDDSLRRLVVKTPALAT